MYTSSQKDARAHKCDCELEANQHKSAQISTHQHKSTQISANQHRVMLVVGVGLRPRHPPCGVVMVLMLELTDEVVSWTIT